MFHLITRKGTWIRINIESISGVIIYAEPDHFRSEL